MIPDEVVEQVRGEADAVSIIGEFVKLRRSGSSFRGPCPFHGGTNPNFSVSPTGGYYCFVCHEKGDVFTFVQKRLGLDFVEAVKLVGARAGVDVREVSRRDSGPDSREPLWELNQTAADFFHRCLWEGDEGAPAREYLESRGFTRADSERFRIGFSPPGAAAMRDYLSSLGFSEERQLAAGLLTSTEDRPELRPRFRNRLMFAIADQAGHLVGFGGRVLGSGTPKYVNTAESELFAKRRLLYGLDMARGAIRRAERVFIVEGYFDVIRLMIAGAEEVVAPMGTALTEEQTALVHKFAKTAYLLYDSDKAGLRATFRSGDALLASGVAVRVVSLPGGDDPDTYVAKTGREGLERAVEDSVDVFDRRIQILERAGYFSDLRKKREALDKLLPTIRLTADPLTRDLYIARTSEVAGVSRDLLESELSQPSGPRAPRETGGPGAPERALAGDKRRSREPRSRSIASPPGRGSAALRAERELVRAMLHQRGHIELVGERLSPDAFVGNAYRQIFAGLLAAGEDATPEDLSAELDEAGIAVLHELMEERGGLERSDELVAGALSAILARDVDRRLAEITRDLPLAEADVQDELIKERMRLSRELQGLGQARWKGFNSPR